MSANYSVRFPIYILIGPPSYESIGSLFTFLFLFFGSCNEIRFFSAYEGYIFTGNPPNS